MSTTWLWEMAKPLTTTLIITLYITTTSSSSGYHTADSSNQTDFRVRVHCTFRVVRNLSVGLGMELLMDREVCLSK